MHHLRGNAIPTGHVQNPQILSFFFWGGGLYSHTSAPINVKFDTEGGPQTAPRAK